MRGNRQFDPHCTPVFKPHDSKEISFWPESTVSVKASPARKAKQPPYFPVPTLKRGDFDVVYSMPQDEFFSAPPSQKILVPSVSRDEAEGIAARLRKELEDETGREVDVVAVVQEIVTQRFHERMARIQSTDTDRPTDKGAA